METPAPAADNTNGSSTAATPELPRSQSAGEEEVSPQHQVRLCKLQKWADFDGYGFNLHAEKDKPGQFIGTVDPNSPAETGGVKEGDRIIEVNGENIEAQTHRAVIERVKAGGDRTQLLLVDRAADAYYKSLGLTLSSTMVGVVVISTPSSLSAKSEETETITAVVAEAVESAPEPPPQEEETVPNGAPLNGEQEQEGEEAVPAASDVAQAVIAAAAVDDVVQDEKQKEEEVEENVQEAYDYELVSSPAYPPPHQEDSGAASNGISGGSEVPEPEPEPVRAAPEPVAAAPEPVKAPEPEPEPAVIRSTVTTTNTSPAVDGDLNLHLSAAEMKERLRARKKQDPRLQKTSFEAKSKMFERM